MAKVRVLIVEDSVTVRKRLAEMLSSDPDFEIAGEAEDGKQAIEMCRQCTPDVISMDMMLPVMSGLAATEYIMAHCPTPILVVSASTNRGELFKIYEALAAGAVDVLEKPADLEAEDGEWEQRYRSRLRLTARIRVITHPRARLPGMRGPPLNGLPVLSARPPPIEGCDLVAFGASTGGPGAIVSILRALPADFRLPILIVLHINETFGAAIADWLDAQSGRPVSYAKDGMPLAAAAGRVLVAPGGRHLVLRNGRLRLTREPERHSCRPSVDVLFESIAAECGPRAAACLLTGMGKDGAQGLLKVRKAGGMTIAQDQSTCVVYGMPREAVRLGAAQLVLRLHEIGPALASLRGLAMEARP